MIRDICKDELFLARKAAPVSAGRPAHRAGPAGNAHRPQRRLRRHGGEHDRRLQSASSPFESEDGYLVMFNPVILKKSGPYETEEGCLSLTGTRKTKRFQTIKVQWQNEKFQTRIKTFIRLDRRDHPARARPLRRHPHLRRKKPCGGCHRAFLLPEITWADGRCRRGCRRRRRGSGRSRSRRRGRPGRRRGRPYLPGRPSGLRGSWR